MKEWLSRLKYRGDERLQVLFAGMMEGVLERLLSEFKLKKKHVAFITYVPLSEERYAERGFNQTELIARRLGAAFGIPVRAILRRTQHTDKQSYKTRAERLRDLSGVFEAEPIELPPIVAARNLALTNVEPTITNAPTFHTPAFQATPILLLDDVYTTGSTLNECAKAIRQSLDAPVYGLTWAR